MMGVEGLAKRQRGASRGTLSSLGAHLAEVEIRLCFEALHSVRAAR